MAIVTMRSKLTDADIRTLVKGPSEDARAQAAHKICRSIDTSELNEEERAHAQQILSIMAADAAVLVRRALAVALKNSPKLPHEVALKLAQDVDSIALPVIMNSPVFSDVDLVEIVRSCPPAKQIAVASRETLPLSVTSAIAAYAVPEAVTRALSNDNAEFDEAGLSAALDRFADLSSVTTAMVKRNTLPVAVTEKLVALVSGELFDHLVNNHELPAQVAIELAMGSRERATLDLVEQAELQGDMSALAQRMHINGRLTPSVIMRALCSGHMAFVEHALAELSGLPHQRAWIMVHDSGGLGLKTIFDRAGLPPRLYASFRAAIEVYHQAEREGGAADRLAFRTRMIERTLTMFKSIPKDDLDYLLDKLDALGARENASATA